MANGKTIKQRIQLDGGADIEKEFNDLGEAGKKAFADLKAAALASQTQLTGFSKIFAQAKRDLVSIQKQAAATAKAYDEFSASVKGVATNIGLVGAAVIGAGVAIVEFTKHAADTADQTNKAAQAAGLSIDQYGKLQFVFEQGNVNAEAFGTAMKKLNTNIVQAASGTGVGAKLFDQLGISVKGANGQLKPTDQILQELANKFQSLSDGPAKSALAIQLFGKAGASIIPVLDDGGKAMQDLEARAVSLGLVLDKTAGKIGDDFGDALNELKRAIGGIGTQIGLQLAPALTDAFKAVTQLITDNRKTILAFTQNLVTQVGPAIKDFINAISGNDSAVANKNFLAIRDTVASIGQALGVVAGLINALVDALTSIVQPFVDLWNALTGQHVQAQAVVFTGLILLLSGAFGAVGKGITLARTAFELLVKVFGSAAGTVGLVGTLFTGIFAEAIITVENLASTIQAWGAVVTDVFTKASQFVATVWDLIVQGANGMAAALLAIINDFEKKGLGAFSDLINGVTGFFTDLADQVGKVIDGIVSKIKDAISFATTLGGLLGGGSSSSDSSSSNNGGGGGFAAGGLLRGRGTGTSDSIIARVSNGEFIVQAKAVSKYGVGLLNAINGMRFTPPRFALGGPVLASAGPSMPLGDLAAAGGSSGRPFALHIGGEVFNDLIAPDTVAQKLVRFASAKATRSAGRRPSWRK